MFSKAWLISAVADAGLKLWNFDPCHKERAPCLQVASDQPGTESELRAEPRDLSTVARLQRQVNFGFEMPGVNLVSRSSRQ